jgi:predicted TIM-barrel fold metal-dependent hydrolase
MHAIDIHGHYGTYDRGAAQLSDRMMSGEVEDVRRRARAAGIMLTVVSPLRALFPYGGDVLAANEETLTACSEFDDLCFWAVLDPQIRQTYSQVEIMLRHPRCCGIKIHPRDHGYEIREHGAAIFEFANAQAALILSHSGDLGSYPEDFVAFANHYPGVPLIMAHVGNSDNGHMSRQVYAIKRARAGNLYTDTSSIRSMSSGLIEWAVGEIGSDHILFGTDTPLYFTAAQKARIEFAEIDDTAKRAILFGNAARLLQSKIPEIVAISKSLGFTT